MTPRVEGLSPEYRAVCVYAKNLGDPQCGEPATVHVQVNDDTYGVVAIASCDAHAPIARRAAPVIDEHVYEGVCGFPGTLWDDGKDRCVIDDSGEEPPVEQSAGKHLSLIDIGAV